MLEESYDYDAYYSGVGMTLYALSHDETAPPSVFGTTTPVSDTTSYNIRFRGLSVLEESYDYGAYVRCR